MIDKYTFVHLSSYYMPRRIITSERISRLRGFWKTHGRVPSIRELCRLLEHSSPNAGTRFCRAAVAAGYLRRGERGYAAGHLLTGLKCYESIAAGWPSPAEDELVDVITLDEYLIGNREAAFLVKVTGDSMKDAGIMAGDIIVVDRGARPKSGDIVIAQVDGEWTLKYYTRRGDKIVLTAANEKYPEIAPKSELVIGGVVSGSFRKYAG